MGLLLGPFLLVLVAVALVALAFGGGREKRRVDLAEGRRLLESGQTAEALTVFDRLARRSLSAPDREAALYWLGQTLEAMERHDAARRVYLRYLADYELNQEGPRPTREVHERVRAALAALLQEPASEGPPSAWERHRREVEPEAGEERMSLKEIRALMEAGRFQAALAQLVRHVARPVEAPGREAALHLLGLCYEGLGRPEQARTVYRRYMREYGEALSPHRPSTRILLRVADRLRALGPEGAEGEASGPWARFKGELRRIKDHLLPEGAEGAEGDANQASSGAEPPRVDEAALARDRTYLDRGVRVGEFVLAEKLGDGGFGEVFRALRPVAIKFARDPEAVEHLKRFAEVQGKLSSPRIVRPLEFDLEATPPWVAMELVDGPTLRDLIRHRQRLPVAEALAILVEVARGLDDAHRAGALHLDLKPENVLLGRDGAVKLTDFELGGQESEADELALSLSFRSRAEHLAGTLAYMSPEQRAGKRADARSDLFTFGVILFEALTGTLPEPGDRPSAFVKSLPPQVDAMFERCFARHERRYATAEELVRDLEQALARLPEQADLREALRDVPRRAHADALPRALAERVEAPRQREEGEVPSDVVRAVVAAAAIVEEPDPAPPLALAPALPEPAPALAPEPAPALAPEPTPAPAPTTRPPLETLLLPPALDPPPPPLAARPPLHEVLAARELSEPPPEPTGEAAPEPPARALEGPG